MEGSIEIILFQKAQTGMGGREKTYHDLIIWGNPEALSQFEGRAGKNERTLQTIYMHTI